MIKHSDDLVVLVDTFEFNVDNGRIKNGLYLYRKIFTFGLKGIRKIKAVELTLYTEFFENSSMANHFAVYESLKQASLRAFIPKKNTPTDLSKDEILKDIISEIKVTSVKRLYRRFVGKMEGNVTRISSLLVKIGFEGTAFPKNDFKLYDTKG